MPQTGRVVRMTLLGVAVALAVLPGIAFGATATLTVDGISAVIPSPNQGTCPTQIDVGFLVTITDPTGWDNLGIDPSTVNGDTVTIDGSPASGYGTMTLYRADPPYYFINVDVSDSTVGQHTLWIKGGTSGVRWTATGHSPNIEAFLAADYTTIFSISECDPSFRPDGRIRNGSGSFIGNNIYNTTGGHQTRKGSAAPGNTITFEIQAQNDGPSDSFTILATGAATAKYRVRYFHGTTDITAAVVAGTYTTPVLAPGDKYLITARVKVKSSATAGSSITRVVTITSVGDARQQDAVRFTGKRN